MLTVDTFWSNTVWYVLLAVITAGELAYVLVKSARRQLNCAFYLTLAGLVFLVEVALLIIGGAYTYYPMILHNHPDPFNDNIAGNAFSQYSLAATALLVAVFNLKYYWVLAFAALYGVIEELFLALGIYRHNWYQTWMTLLLVPALCGLAKYMYARAGRGLSPSFYYGYILLALFPLASIPTIWGLKLALLIDYQTTLCANPEISRATIGYPLFFSVAATMMLVYYLQVKYYWKGLMVLLLYAVIYAADQLNLVLVREGWFLPVATIITGWMYVAVFILDRLYRGHKNHR